MFYMFMFLHVRDVFFSRKKNKRELCACIIISVSVQYLLFWSLLCIGYSSVIDTEVVNNCVAIKSGLIHKKSYLLIMKPSIPATINSTTIIDTTTPIIIPEKNLFPLHIWCTLLLNKQSVSVCVKSVYNVRIIKLEFTWMYFNNL